jgi:hypothetical protein
MNLQLVLFRKKSMGFIYKSSQVLLFILFSSLLVNAAVELKSDIILNSRWHLHGPQNRDGNTYSRCPLYQSVTWSVAVNKRIDIFSEYSYIPVKILSQEYLKIEYDGDYYWLRQSLEFGDSRLKVGVGLVVLDEPAFGRIINRLGFGGSLNSIINERYSILISPEFTGFPVGSKRSGPPLQNSLKKFYPQGFCWFFSEELLWEKSLNKRTCLLLGCKYEFARYDDKEVWPAFLSNYKNVKIVSNKLIAVSVGISYRLRKD